MVTISPKDTKSQSPFSHKVKLIIVIIGFFRHSVIVCDVHVPFTGGFVCGFVFEGGCGSGG